MRTCLWKATRILPGYGRKDEWESLSLNYTSGTTGKPKGVVYHHRGATMNTYGQVISWRLALYPVYLTIVPLFHCNGWCHTWMMPLLGGTVVCCRDITAEAIYDAIATEGVTHFGGAPIVLNTLIHGCGRPEPVFPHGRSVHRRRSTRRSDASRSNRALGL